MVLNVLNQQEAHVTGTHHVRTGATRVRNLLEHTISLPEVTILIVHPHPLRVVPHRVVALVEVVSEEVHVVAASVVAEEAAAEDTVAALVVEEDSCY